MDRLAEHISMHLVKEDVCVMQDMQHQRMEVEEENARRVQLGFFLSFLLRVLVVFPAQQVSSRNGLDL